MCNVGSKQKLPYSNIMRILQSCIAKITTQHSVEHCLTNSEINTEDLTVYLLNECS